MSELKVGLIGCGGMGMNLARKCNSLDNAIITAVYDPDKEAITKAAEELNASKYRSYKKLMGSDVDAVIIASPNSMHYRQTIDAAKLGKHIFCEKPMAFSVKECKAMIDAAEKTGVKLMVGQVLRLLPPMWQSHKIVSSGELGKPFAMAVTRLSGPDSLAKGWRGTKKHAWGVLYEVHVHELDFMRHIMGEAVSVYAQTGHFTEAKVEYEDVAFVQIKYASGGIGTLHCGISSSIAKYEMMIQCEKGTLTNQGFSGPIQYSRFKEDPAAIQPADIQKEDGYREEVRSWVDSITKGIPMVFDGSDGMAAIALVEVAYRSARTGRVIKL